MRKLFLLGIIATLFLSNTSIAQSYEISFKDSFEYNSNEFNQKSKAIALSLTLGVPTILAISSSSLLDRENESFGAILLVTGLLIGPSTGNMYARNRKDVWRGISIRFIASGIMIAGSAILFQNCLVSCERDPFFDVTGYTTFFTGVGLFLYSIYNDARKSVRNVDRYNARNITLISISPVYYSNLNKMGIGLNFRF
jgi:hypothetical protein